MRTRAILLTSTLLLAALGCRDDAESPTEADLSPAATGVPAASGALAFWQLSTGHAHTCGVTTDNVAYCWGRNFDGQVGDGVEGPGPGYDNFRTRPTAVLGGLHFKRVDVGRAHTCGVTTSNEAYCWGSNSSGQLGYGTTTEGRPTPRAVAGSLRFRMISTGFGHTCGVTTNDKAYCWGGNSHGELGDGSTTKRLAPVAVKGGLSWKLVSAGDAHTCGVTTTKQVYCWGSNEQGQVGDNSTTSRRLKPVAVAGTRRYNELDAGVSHTCAVNTGGRAFCWGQNEAGQLGDGTTTDRRVPTRVAGGLEFGRVTAGADHTCGETTVKGGYCWGASTPWGGGIPSPSPVPGGHRFAQVSAGERRTCGKTTASVGYCWGQNDEGELGDGTTVSRSEPTPVAAPS